jgi:GrpB-like predicted nucleotidyltransferase (UPF0157 family)
MKEIDPIEIVPYNSEWPRMFEEESDKLKKLFSDYRSVIEHIGSTAIPDINAKPVIDIMLGFLDDITQEEMIKKLVDLGYEWWEKDRHKHVRLFFVKWNEKKTKRTHQIHAMHQTGSEFWKDHIAFRDKLRADSDLAKEYSDLKNSLMKEVKNNRHKYIEGKTAFVKRVLN